MRSFATGLAGTGLGCGLLILLFALFLGVAFLVWYGLTLLTVYVFGEFGVTIPFWGTFGAIALFWIVVGSIKSGLTRDSR